MMKMHLNKVTQDFIEKRVYGGRRVVLPDQFDSDLV